MAKVTVHAGDFLTGDGSGFLCYETFGTEYEDDIMVGAGLSKALAKRNAHKISQEEIRELIHKKIENAIK